MGELRFIGGTMAFALGAAPLAALAADQPLQMAPASAWEVDDAEDSCALRRSFRSADDEVSLELRQFGPGDGFQITVLSPTLSRASGPVRVRFDPDEGFHKIPATFPLASENSRGVLFADNMKPNAVKRLRPPQPEWSDVERDARERAITALTVGSVFTRTVTLQVGPLSAPMDAMQSCLDDLLTRWGLDAEVQQTLSRKARPLDLADWARRVQQSYPPEMVRRERNGLVNIRLVIGPDGVPTACLPDKVFSTAGFDEHACALTMRHARFEPALDAKGTPVPTVYSTTITYQIHR